MTDFFDMNIDVRKHYFKCGGGCHPSNKPLHESCFRSDAGNAYRNNLHSICIKCELKYENEPHRVISNSARNASKRLITSLMNRKELDAVFIEGIGNINPSLLIGNVELTLNRFKKELEELGDIPSHLDHNCSIYDGYQMIPNNASKESIREFGIQLFHCDNLSYISGKDNLSKGKKSTKSGFNRMKDIADKIFNQEKLSNHKNFKKFDKYIGLKRKLKEEVNIFNGGQILFF
jgi:hypothetical protein